ncbi:MAG TPA: hypothetical protein EYQ53_02540 [Candidatus Poseidoniales archaeon]|nr:hypothetical protein [Candidatus Poseidoniales archaeon]HIK78504.1 hypothetical protein [Candidatus Poseidoniales archaeon]
MKTNTEKKQKVKKMNNKINENMNENMNENTNEKVNPKPVTATVEVADHTGHTSLQLTKQQTVELANENPGHWIFADGQLVNVDGLNEVNWEVVDKVRLVPGLVGGASDSEKALPTVKVEIADHTGHSTLQLTQAETVAKVQDNSTHWVFADGQLVNADQLGEMNWAEVQGVRLVPGLVGGDAEVSGNRTKSPAVLLVGAGGIGSSVIELLVPALERCNTRCQIDIMDDDKVKETNLGHQKFTSLEVGQFKVDALANRFEDAKNIIIDPITERLTQGSQLEYYDLVIVAVDSPTPRKIVHTDAAAWLDLRCRGDGWLLLDNNTNPEIVSSLSPTHKPTSCQIEGAIAAGNIEFGFAAVAAAGAQWAFQFIRQYYGNNTSTPSAQMSSLTHGSLPLPSPPSKVEVVA